MFRRINSTEPFQDSLNAASKKAKEKKKSDVAVRLLKSYAEVLRTGNREEFDKSFLEYAKEFGL